MSSGHIMPVNTHGIKEGSKDEGPVEAKVKTGEKEKGKEKAEEEEDIPDQEDQKAEKKEEGKGRAHMVGEEGFDAEEYDDDKWNGSWNEG